MNKRLIIFLAFGSVLISCEGIIHGSGKVISSQDNSPLQNVKINWRNFDETYTDEHGMFEITKFVGCVPKCPELELILTKKGFETKYVNLSKDSFGHLEIKNVTIKLEPTEKPGIDFQSKNGTLYLYYSALFISFLSLCTLLFSLWIKLKNRLFWVIVIVFGTFSIQYNYISHEFKLKLFRLFLQINPLPLMNPGWYKYILPLGVIAFWIYYFRNRSIQTKNVVQHRL